MIGAPAQSTKRSRGRLATHGYRLFGHYHTGRREADFIFGRMRHALDEFGTDFTHSVRLDQYYPNPRAVAAYHLARHDAFGDYIPPSTSVVMERCFDAPSAGRRGCRFAFSQTSCSTPDRGLFSGRLYHGKGS
jgi:hypothetical protein